MKRRKYKIILIAGACLFGLIVAVFFYVNSGAFIRRHILPIVAERLGEPVSAGDITFSVFSGILIKDLKVGKDKPLASVDLIVVKHQIRPLFSGEVQLDVVAVRGLRVDAEEERVRRILDRLTAGPKSDSTLKINVARVEVDAPSIRYKSGLGEIGLTGLKVEGTDVGNIKPLSLKVSSTAKLTSGEQEAVIDSFKLDAKGALLSDFMPDDLTLSGTASCASGSFQGLDLGEKDVVFKLKGGSDGKAAKIESFVLQAQHKGNAIAAVSLSGAVTEKLSGSVEFDIALPNNGVIEIVRPIFRSHGVDCRLDSLSYKGNLQFGDNLSSIVMDAGLSIDRLSAKQTQPSGISLERLTVQSVQKLTASPKKGELNIDNLSFTVKTAENETLCSATARGNEKKFVVTTDVPNIGALQAFLPAKLIDTLNGKLSTRFEGSMTKESVGISGNVQLKNFEAVAKDIVAMDSPHDLKVDLSADYAFSGAAELKSCSVYMVASGKEKAWVKCRASARIEPGLTKGTTNLELSETDLNQLRTILPPKIAEQVSMLQGNVGASLKTDISEKAVKTVGEIHTTGLQVALPGALNMAKPHELNIAFDGGYAFSGNAFLKSCSVRLAASGAEKAFVKCQVSADLKPGLAKGSTASIELSEADLGQFRSILPPMISKQISSLRGDVSASFKADLSNESVQTTGKVGIEGLQVALPGILNMAKPHELSISMDAGYAYSGAAFLKSCAVRLTRPGKSRPVVECLATADLTPSLGEGSTARLKVKGIDLEQIHSILPADFPVSRLSGLGNLEVVADVGQEIIATDLTMRLLGVKVGLPDSGELATPLAVQIVGKASIIRSAGLATVDRLQFRVVDEKNELVKGKVKASVTLGAKRRAEVSITLPERIDTNKLLALWKPVKTTKVAEPAKPTGGSFPFPITVTLNAKQIDYAQISAKSIRTKAVLNGSVADVEEMSCSLNGGNIRAKARVDLGKAGVLPSYRFGVSGRDVQFSPILKSFPAYAKLLPIDFTGGLKDLKLRGKGKGFDTPTMLKKLESYGEYQLTSFQVKKFNGLYAKTLGMLLQIYGLTAADMKFDGGQGSFSMLNGTVTIDKSKMGSDGIRLYYWGKLRVTPAKVDPDLYVQGDLPGDRARKITKYVYVAPQPNDRFYTNEIRLKGDLSKVKNILGIIAAFAVKPEYREETALVLALANGETPAAKDLLKVGVKRGLKEYLRREAEKRRKKREKDGKEDDPDLGDLLKKLF